VFYNRILNDNRFNNYDVFYYDYNYNDSLESNGRAFAASLCKAFQPNDSVVIVAHSMGGLVARLAILAREMLFVHCLFLLGTPNLGAIRTVQLALLAQLALDVTRMGFAVFPRKRGILDLTQAATILEKYRNNSQYADHVDYVSIPGLFYHEGRSPWESSQGTMSKLFTALLVGLGILHSIIPVAAIKLKRPHDGIVERDSNCLIPCEAGRESEKCASINFPDKVQVSYAHVEPDSSRRLTHVQLQSDNDIYEIIAEIIFSRIGVDPQGRKMTRLENWRACLTRKSLTRITQIKMSR
jgi:pimeloyl-ACP methyl ester carboxylesterase